MRADRILLFATVCLVAAACEKPKTEYRYELPSHWPPRAVFPGIGSGLIAVTNAGEDTVSLHDFSLQKVASIPIGLLPIELEGPHHILASPDGQYLYAGLSYSVSNGGTGPHGSHGTGTAPGYLLKIRTQDMRVVGQARVDRNPGDFAITPDGSTAYVSHFDVNRAVAGTTPDEKRSAIAVVDLETMTRTALVPMCPAEHGVSLNADATRLYVTCYGSDHLAIVDVTQPSLPATFVPLGPSPGALPGTLEYGPYALTPDPDGTTLWVSCWDSNDVRAFDTVTGQIDASRTLPIGGNPMFGAALGGKTYLPRQGDDIHLPDDRIAVIGSNGVTATYPLDARCPNAHAAVPVPGWPDALLVVCEGHHVEPGMLMMLEASTGAVLATAQAGVYPDAAVFLLPGGGP